MLDKTSEKSLLQVVFLIDVNSSLWIEESQAKDVSSAVRLCILKILRYFGDHLCERLSDLKWGFKFFSSKSLLRDYRRHEFEDFKVSTFEAFEQQVSRKFEEEFEKAKEPQQQPAEELDGDEIPAASKPSPAKCLTCSLTELVHDFQWDKLDICSPVKRSRQGSQSEQQNTRNIVFLLSNCPCSEEAMKIFTEVTVKTPDSLRSTLLPAALEQQFKDTHRISLFWVDTGMLYCKQRKQVIPHVFYTLYISHLNPPPTPGIAGTFTQTMITLEQMFLNLLRIQNVLVPDLFCRLHTKHESRIKTCQFLS